MFSIHLTDVTKLELLVTSTVSHRRYMPLAEIQIVIVLNNVMCELYNYIYEFNNFYSGIVIWLFEYLLGNLKAFWLSKNCKNKSVCLLKMQVDFPQKLRLTKFGHSMCILKSEFVLFKSETITKLSVYLSSFTIPVDSYFLLSRYGNKITILGHACK